MGSGAAKVNKNIMDSVSIKKQAALLNTSVKNQKLHPGLIIKSKEFTFVETEDDGQNMLFLSVLCLKCDVFHPLRSFHFCSKLKTNP